MTVSRLIPGTYEAYVQVLHGIYLPDGDVDLRALLSGTVVSEARVRIDDFLSDRGVTLAPVANSRSRSLGDWRAIRGTRIRWHELARVLGGSLGTPASFTRDLWDRISGDWPDALDGPPEGSLTQVDCERLLANLAPFSRVQVTFDYCWYNTRDRAGRCDRGALEDLAEYFARDDVEGSPEYWWPDDRTWIVHTNVDSSYSLVGGSRTLVEALLDDLELECVEVGADSLLTTG